MQSYTIDEEHFATLKSAPSQFVSSAETPEKARGRGVGGGEWGEGTLLCLLPVISDGRDSVLLLFRQLDWSDLTIAAPGCVWAFALGALWSLGVTLELFPTLMGTFRTLVPNSGLPLCAEELQTSRTGRGTKHSRGLRSPLESSRFRASALVPVEVSLEADNIGAPCTPPQAPSHTHFVPSGGHCRWGCGARFARSGGKPEGLGI